MQKIFKDRGIIYQPAVHLYTIVWLHGLGDSARGFEDLFDERPLLPNCKFVLLTAPQNPVTVNGGAVMNSWYDFKTIEDEYDPSAEVTAELLCRVLEEERKSTNVLILGGLSQGAVMSLYVGLSKFTGRLEAVIGLSGYAFPMQISEEKKRVPVFMYHGARDDLLTLRRTQRTIERHLGGVNLTFKVDNFLGHSISMQEWAEVSNWLKATLNIQ